MHVRAPLPILIATIALLAGLLGSFHAPVATAGLLDMDEDGIADVEDLCLHEPGPEANDGCPDAELVFSGLVGTKLNSANPIKIQTTVELEISSWLEAAQASTAAAAQGAIRFNTADTNAWKSPVKTAASTWTLTIKAGNSASAGVYLNGQWRAMQVGTQLTIKLNNEGKTLYLKFAGMAPNGVGTNRVGVEAESVGGGLEGPLALVSHTPAQDAVTGASPLISATFNGPLSGFNLNSATIDCGSGTAAFTSGIVNGKTVTLAPVGPLPAGATCTVFIAASAPSDLDAIDPPDGMVSNYYFSFLVDEPPSVLFTTPDDGSIVGGPSVVVAVAFSEPVTLDAGAVLISGCASHSSAAQPTAGLYFNYQANGATSGTCTITVVASKVHDVDTADAPDTMLADYTATFSIETPPVVTIVSPVDGSTTGTQPQLHLTSDEFVWYAAGAIEISGCTSWTNSVTTPWNIVNFTLPALPEGTTCTLTVHRMLVFDVDAIGGDHPLEDESVTFTVDSAPTIVSTELIDDDNSDSSETMDPTGHIRVKYSEPIAIKTFGAWGMTCEGITIPMSLTIDPNDNTAIILEPADSTVAGLHGGPECNAFIGAFAIGDVDSADAPDYAPGHIIQFDMNEVAPFIVDIYEVENNFDPDEPFWVLVVKFSEPVAWKQGGFDVDLGVEVDGGVMAECGTTGTTAYFGGLTPGSSTFSYSEQLPYRPTGCDFSINEELIWDTDTNDGPDLLVGGGATFHFPGVVWP